MSLMSYDSFPRLEVEISCLSANQETNFYNFVSSFVGMAIMLLLMPVPGRVASLLRNAQRQRMKKAISLLVHKFCHFS
jgi:hypothetical protein